MSSHRTVRRLHLRGPSESALHRARVTLEDAVRVASLPDRPGRLVVVRRVVLPAMRSDAPSQAWASALEAAMERSGPAWVHGATAEAADAQVVWFEDALEAHLHAALRLSRGASLEAWFWPLAIPALRDPRARRDSPRGLRALALSLASRVEAPTALPRWVARLVDAGVQAGLQSSLASDDLPLLARAAGIAWPPGARAMAARRAPRLQPSEETEAATGPGDVAPAAALLSAVAVKGGARGRFGPAERRGDVRPHDVPAVDGGPGRTSGPGRDHGGDTRPGKAARAEPGTLERAQTGAREREQPGRPFGADRGRPDPESSQGLPTRAGGLLFLIAVLHRIGYPEWLARQPGWARHDPARHVFASVLARLEVPDLDPAWSVARVPGRDTGPVPSRFLAPPHWSPLCRPGPRHRQRWGEVAWAWDASERLLLAAWNHGPRSASSPGDASPDAGPPSMARAWRTGSGRIERVAGAWLTACRRWTRRTARLGLADLVHRPALLSATTTHVDVTLDLSHTDLRLRRTGLDLDPGWVPWLGRVVSFHYQAGVDGGGPDVRA